MIRPFTCVCVLLAAASGLYLYQAKHRVQLLDRQIQSVVAQTQAARARSGVLRAEWTLMNDPERLAHLADKFIQLKTVTPGQFTTMAELDNRLPAIRVPDAKAPDAAPDEPQQEPIALAPETPQAPAASPPVPTATVAAKPAAEPKPAPVKLAAERPKPEPTKVEHKPPHDAATQVASAAPTAAPRAAGNSLVTRVSAAAPLPRPVPVAAFDQTANGFGSSAPVRDAHNTRPPVPASPPAHFVGSALGMAHTTLGAPVPVSAALPAPIPFNQPNGN